MGGYFKKSKMQSRSRQKDRLARKVSAEAALVWCVVYQMGREEQAYLSEEILLLGSFRNSTAFPFEFSHAVDDLLST